MGALNDLFSQLERFCRGGQYGTERNPITKNIVVIGVLVLIAFYFIQKWTNIPLYDWTTGAMEWIGKGILYLLEKLLDLMLN